MASDDKLDEIRQRLERSSQGPWTLGFNRSMRSAWAIQRAESSQAVVNLDPEKNIDLDSMTNRVEDDLDFLQNSRADIEWLLAEVQSLRANVKPAETSSSDFLQTELIEASQQREQFREALAFYANPETYRKPPPEAGPGATWIGTDVGRLARRTLGTELPPSAPASESAT